MKNLVFISSLCLVLLGASCSSEKAEVPIPVEDLKAELCGDTTISYVNDVIPIIEANCKFEGCHLAPTNAPYTMEPLSGFQDYVNNNQSTFFGAIDHTGPIKMPLGGNKLPDSSIVKLKCWVLQGSLDN